MSDGEHVHGPEGDDDLVVVPRVIDLNESTINVGMSEDGAVVLDLITGGIVERFIMVPVVGLRLGPALFNTAVQAQMVLIGRMQEGNDEA